MQNIPAGLIPYNHEKYLTGKYIAETRGGFRPDEVVYLKGSNQPITFVDDEKETCSCYEDGCYVHEKEPLQHDLFLRPKTSKKWAAYFLDDPLFETKEECERSCSSHTTFIKAVEVEVNED